MLFYSHLLLSIGDKILLHIHTSAWRLIVRCRSYQFKLILKSVHSYDKTEELMNDFSLNVWERRVFCIRRRSRCDGKGCAALPRRLFWRHLYLAVSAPGAADTGRSPTGPSAAPRGGDSGEGPHLRAAYSCSAAAGPPPPNSSESRRACVAPPATGHTSALQCPGLPRVPRLHACRRFDPRYLYTTWHNMVCMIWTRPRHEYCNLFLNNNHLLSSVDVTCTVSPTLNIKVKWSNL